MIGEVSGDDVDDAGPLPHHLQRREGREHLDQRRRPPTACTGKIAALRIGRTAVEPAAHHQLALVGLADIGAVPRWSTTVSRHGLTGSLTIACSV